MNKNYTKLPFSAYKNLINQDLWLALYCKQSIENDDLAPPYIGKSHNNIVLPRSKKGVYLVVFRELRQNTGTLIYNYMYYP